LNGNSKNGHKEEDDENGDGHNNKDNDGSLSETSDLE
jgi:hypothetical protein